MCTPIISAVPYLFTGLAGCSVDLGNSCGARKLARTPRVIQKKSDYLFLYLKNIFKKF
jgi:hypothetical protein